MAIVRHATARLTCIRGVCLTSKYKNMTDYTVYGERELIERIHELERVLNALLDLTNDTLEKQEARIQAYETLGMTRSDAQAVVEAEELTHNLA